MTTYFTVSRIPIYMWVYNCKTKGKYWYAGLMELVAINSAQHGVNPPPHVIPTLIKKKRKFSSSIRKFRGIGYKVIYD